MEVGGVNEKGEKILEIIKDKNCTIVFVEQEGLENNLDGLYETVVRLLLQPKSKSFDTEDK